MRTRYKETSSELRSSIPAFACSANTVPCSGPALPAYNFTYPSSGPLVTIGSSERMTDSLGKGTAHPVIHRKVTWDLSVGRDTIAKPYVTAPGGIITYSPAIANQLEADYYIGVVDGDINQWFTTSNTGYPPIWDVSSPQANEAGIINDLMSQASQLKADVLLNIVEGNQLWPSLRSLTMSLPNMAKNWKSIRKVLSTASGSYLAYKFGIGPVVQDLKNIAKYAPDMANQFERYRNGENSRFVKALPLTCKFSKSPETYGSFNGFPVYGKSWQGFQAGKAETRYVLVVAPSVRPRTEFFKELTFAMNRFTTSPASLAWERIPFSFVLDWFVDIRGPLRALDDAVRVSPYKVVSFTKSTVYNLVSEAFWDFYSPCGGTKIWTGRAHREFKHYERSVVNSQVLLPTSSGRFGKNQAAISAALITQALTGLRAKR